MMGTYRVEWPCCDSVTETQSWEPERCPFCELNETDAELTATRSLVTPDFTAAIRALITPADPDPALLALDARDRRALNALCSLGVAASTDYTFRRVASAALAAWACGGDAVAAIHKALDDIGTSGGADPVTRLAVLGALVTRYNYGEGLARPFWLPVSGTRLDNMARLARVTEGDSLAPGIADAIAALLAPDVADQREGVQP